MAIITHTFIDKSNTLMEGDYSNLGLNPILELYYGVPISRGIIHFDTDKLRNLVDDGVYPDMSKLHHVLKMKNVAGLETPYRHRRNKYNDAERAVSFDLVFFLINKDWDAGCGFDYLKDVYMATNVIHSTDGSNWYNATNIEGWDIGGIYTRTDLLDEYIIRDDDGNLCKQHFDIGNEDIEIDLTSVVNKMINGEIENHGIGIAFHPDIEQLRMPVIQYVGFFTDHTHSFFRPYLETTYDDYINDDRTNFYLDKPNRLYFYANVGGKMVNLDDCPTCTIDGVLESIKSTQATKGVYYVDLTMPSTDYEPETMFYDTWSNISYNGKSIPNVELYFTTKPSKTYFSFGLPFETKEEYDIIPSIYGINQKENIIQGDIRKVGVSAKIAYTTKQEFGVDKLEYKIYIKAGEAEIPFIDWHPVERGYNENFFLINTNEIPQGRYFIAIKVLHNMCEIIHREVCEFTVEEIDKEIKV